MLRPVFHPKGRQSLGPRVLLPQARPVLFSLRRFLMSVSSFLSKVFRNHGRRNRAPVRKSARCRPALESLDCRLVPANITASLVNGSLSLTDNGAVSFTISQPAENQIKITPDAG